MKRYTLNELEKLTGILAATIRVWERRYKIIQPKRTDTNRRWYDDEDLKKLINISILNQNGIKISRIARYSVSDLEEQVELLSKDADVSDNQIKSLIFAMLTFNGHSVNEILLKSIINIGFEETFLNLVFPFLKRIGIMWHTGTANIGAEHFITNVLRGILITAIDSIPSGTDPHRKRAVLFLPDNELHELGLLFYSYLIRKSGHDVLYLGQTTPVSALIEACEKWHADILVTGTLSELSVSEPENYLQDLSTTFNTQKILVSGSLAFRPDLDKLKNVYPIKSASDLKHHFHQTGLRN